MNPLSLTALCRPHFGQPDDAPFLKYMAGRFPQLARGFRTFALLPPEKRPASAKIALEAIPFDVFLRAGLPPEQAVSVHRLCEQSKELAFLIAEPPHVTRLTGMIDVLDMPKAVTGDLGECSDIAPLDKRRLEEIAMNVIYNNGHSNILAVPQWREYEQQESFIAQAAREIMLVALGIEALAGMVAFPSLRDKLRADIIDYVELSLTGRAENHFMMIKKGIAEHYPHLGLDMP